MIELNKKTRQDFLDREWVQKLLDAGVDMSDAKYCIMKDKLQDHYYIALDKDIKGEYTEILCMWDRIMPTYTVSELMYKLHEYIYPTIDGKQFSGGLKFCKDAPFYMFYYALKTKDYDPQLQQGEYNENYIYAEFEYPIESLASLLIQCKKRGLGCVGNISNK